MPQDKVKEVYDLVSDLGYFEDENDFRSYVLDPNKRKEAYALISDAGYFEDENDFNSYFSDVKKKEQTQPFGGQIFTQGIGLGVKPISSTTSPSVSKQPKSIIPSEFTVEKPVSTAVGNIDLAAKAEDVSQRAEYLGKVSEGVLDIINKNPDIYISQKDIPTMYGEKVIPAGTPKVENISKAVDLYAEKIKKETGKDLLDADKQFLVQSVLSSLKNKKLNVEASSMTDLQLQGKKKLPLTAITGIKDEKGAVVKEGMFEENIKNIVSEEQMRLEKLSKTPSKEVSAEFSPEIEQLKSEVKNNSAALNAEMQSAFASKFDEVQKNVFLKYDGLVKSGQISADEANAQMKKELENIGAQLESDTNILYAPKFEQLKKDVDAKSQEIQTRYNRRVKAQFDLEKVKANKRIQDEVSRYKDALPKEYLEEYQALYQKNFESAMKMDGIKRINEFANLGNFEKMQTALMAGWGDVAGTVGGALSYVGLNTGGLQDWVAQSGIYNELPVFSEENILDNITSTDWWIANGVRSIPFTIATMPVGVVGGASAGMLAKALGASKRAQMISSVVGGGLVGWDAERFLEAGGAFNDAINEGKTLQEASEIAAAVSKYNYATIPLNIAQMLPVFSKSFKFLNSALIEAGSGYFEEVTQGWAQAKAKAQAEGQDVSYLDYLTSPQAVQEGIIGAGMSQGFTLLSLNNTPNIDKQINALMTSIGTGGENQAALMLEVMKNNGSIDSKQYEEAKALLQYTMNAIEQTQNVNVEDSVKSALINKFVAIEKAKELLTDNENDLASQAAKELIEEKEKEIKNILKGTEPVYLVKIKGNDIPVVSTKEQVDAILSNPASLPLFEIEIYNDIKTQASLDEAYSKQEKDAIKTKDEVGSGDTSARTDNTGAEAGDIASVTDKGESGKEVVAETKVVSAKTEVVEYDGQDYNVTTENGKVTKVTRVDPKGGKPFLISDEGLIKNIGDAYLDEVSKEKVEEVPALRDVESTAKALDKIDVSGISRLIDIPQTIETSELDKIPRGETFQERLSPEYFNNLKKDIEENGITEPIILQYYVKDNAMRLKEGHHRLKIAKELGIKEIPVKVNVIWNKNITQGNEDIQGQPIVSPPTAINKEKYAKRFYEPSNVNIEELGYKNKNISETYSQAKSDGSNPELVKAVESLLSKEQAPTKEQKPSEVVSPAEIEAGRQEVSAVKKGKINTTKPIRLFKGLFGKRNPDGTRKSAHPNVKGVFSAVDEKIAERYRGEDGVGTFDIPAGTTIEVIKIENKKVPIPEFRKEETAAINASDAQVVKLITIDARGAEEQYIIKDPALIEKMQKPESQEVAKEQKEEVKEQKVSEAEVDSVAKTTGVTPKNIRDLYNIGRDLFTLNRVQALAQAVVMDKMIGAMAKRKGVKKSEIYKTIQFKKASEKDLPQGVKMQVDAWHGSPYQFDKFELSKIGTGEGAQAFGWGLYFTELEKIAKAYAIKLGEGEWQYDGKSISKKAYDYLFIADDSLGEDFNENTIRDIAKIAIDKINKVFIPDFKEIAKTSPSEIQRKEIPNVIKAAKGVIKELQDIIASKEIKQEKSQLIYKVSLQKGKDQSEYTWLEWDKPLSQKQIDLILNNLPNNPAKRNKVENLKNNINKNGSELYKMLSDIFNSDKQASLFLLENGIDGIKYPAESIARGATSDTARGFNYVVFDENAVSIEEVIKFQKDAVKARGAMMMNMDGQAVIYALSDPNVSTPLHELAHVFEHYLTESEKNEIIKAAGTKGWTIETSEYFARGFEKYLADGKAPSKGLQKLFDKFKEWLTEIYNGLNNSNIDVELNEKMQDIYSQMLGVSVKKKKQEFPENVLDIAKETGLSPQQVQNTYKKYDGSKNIEEITIEDYKNARATGDKTKLEVSTKAFDALLQQENAKTSTSPTAKKNAEKSLKEADEKAIKEASKIMEHINEIRAKIQESGIIESTSCKWGK